MNRKITKCGRHGTESSRALSKFGSPAYDSPTITKSVSSVTWSWTIEPRLRMRAAAWSFVYFVFANSPTSATFLGRLVLKSGLKTTSPSMIGSKRSTVSVIETFADSG
jgi:hypothetical protein